MATSVEVAIFCVYLFLTFSIYAARFDIFCADGMLQSNKTVRLKRKEQQMCAKRDKKPGFDSEFDGASLKIKLRGEIDHHTAAVVRVSMDELIRSRAPRTLLLDMSAVDFMDSSGLGLIMGRYALMQSVGGETVILDPSPATERIMGLAGMERMIKIKKTKITMEDMAREKKGAVASSRRHMRRNGTAYSGVATRSAVCMSQGQENDKRGEAK